MFKEETLMKLKLFLVKLLSLETEKYLLFTVMMILHVHSLKHCFAAGILSRLFLISRLQGGQTIIEKLEEYSQEVGYAIVLATPDDEGKSKSEDSYKSRVRQNVVLELGMFLAKLGREKVAILLKEDIEFEKPSDIHGLIYIPFDKKVDEVAINLIRELSKQGYNIDPLRI